METQTEIFVGMFSSMDPHDLEPGQAELQVNLWSPRQGELASRPGVRECVGDVE
jgi:hypothetical protein